MKKQYKITLVQGDQLYFSIVVRNLWDFEIAEAFIKGHMGLWAMRNRVPNKYVIEGRQ